MRAGFKDPLKLEVIEMGGISITQLLIIAVIVVLLFGTKNCARWAPISAPRSRSFKRRSATIRRRTPTRLKKQPG